MAIPLLQTGPGGTYTKRYLRRGDRLLAVIGSEQLNADCHDHGGRSAGSSHDLAYEESPAAAPPAPATLLDRLLGIDRVELTPESLRRAQQHRAEPAIAPPHSPTSPPSPRSLLAAALRWLEAQRAQVERCLDEAARGLTASLNRESSFNSLAAAGAIAAHWSGETIRDRSPSLSGGHPGRARQIAAPIRQEKRHEPHTQATANSATDPRLANRPWLFPDDAGTRRRTRHQQSHRLRAHRGAHQKGSAQARAQQGTLFVHQ